MEQLEEAIKLIEASVQIAYPQGLPEYDPVYEILQGTEVLEGTGYAKDVYDEDTDCMWYAGKEVLRDEEYTLRDFLGRFERSTMVVKLARQGAGAPTREPTVSEETQKKMMAYYYKKQEEEKTLNKDDDDSYLTAQWADSQKLKGQFLGVGDVQLPF
eukprot:TRINITY_DN4510_c0_g1_i2.p2 TRINITY_DN4510_c0_g1~~TRINITY_DN4510_c0_g1_i2.p2  ORF type:complete len:157 (+),score=57.45 TRINITY_DN4510_c0_g1_i2:152-622(+)